MVAYAREGLFLRKRVGALERGPAEPELEPPASTRFLIPALAPRAPAAGVQLERDRSPRGRSGGKARGFTGAGSAQGPTWLRGPRGEDIQRPGRKAHRAVRARGERGPGRRHSLPVSASGKEPSSPSRCLGLRTQGSMGRGLSFAPAPNLDSLPPRECMCGQRGGNVRPHPRHQPSAGVWAWLQGQVRVAGSRGPQAQWLQPPPALTQLAGRTGSLAPESAQQLFPTGSAGLGGPEKFAGAAQRLVPGISVAASVSSPVRRHGDCWKLVAENRPGAKQNIMSAVGVTSGGRGARGHEREPEADNKGPSARRREEFAGPALRLCGSRAVQLPGGAEVSKVLQPHTFSQPQRARPSTPFLWVPSQPPPPLEVRPAGRGARLSPRDTGSPA